MANGNVGTAAIKEEEINEEGEKKNGERENAAKLKPGNFITNFEQIRTTLESKFNCFPVNTLC